MSKIFRLDAIEINGYYFLNHDGLFWHSGKFWYQEKELKIVFNNGSRAVNLNGSKLGLKKLRTKAIKCRIKIEQYKIPF